MKRSILLLVTIFLSISLYAVKGDKVQAVDSLGRKIKTGWNFGALPSVAFDADLGFQGGALANVYYYGDGSQYPEYIHSLYVEAAYTTKRYGIFRANYDSKYLIPNHRLTLDATYQPDAMCDFYGFRGRFAIVWYRVSYRFLPNKKSLTEYALSRTNKRLSAVPP